MESHHAGNGRLRVSYQQRLLIDMRVNALKPRAAKAYLLCGLLGMFGAHRFYLGERETGIIMLVVGLTIIGLPVNLVWAMRDAFHIPAIIRKRADELRARLTDEAAGEAT